MERKPAEKTKLIAIVLSTVLFLLFTFKSEWCKRIYVNAGTVQSEWDAADVWTMNVFAIIIFLCFSLHRIMIMYLDWPVSTFFIDTSLGISASDIIDRYTGCYFRREGDIQMLILTIIITAAWLIISNRKKIILCFQK